MERSWPRGKASPEDRGEEAGIKGAMEKRALTDSQGKKGTGTATAGRGGRTGAETTGRESASCGLGYFAQSWESKSLQLGLEQTAFVLGHRWEEVSFG